MDAKLRAAILARHGGFPADVSDAELERLWATIPAERRAEYVGGVANSEERVASAKKVRAPLNPEP